MRTRLKARTLLPAIYLAVAFGTWVDFMSLPADGLANLGLMIVVLPISLIDLMLRSSEHPGDSILIPERWGYYLSQSIFFWVSVAIIGFALYWLGRLIERRSARRPSTK